MNIIRHFQSIATRALNPSRWLAAAKRKAMRVEVVAIGLLLMPVILVMADHLPFIDVPSGAFFHDAVSAVYGARITTGTTPSTFSPEDPVTRGQMAVFLHRGLGRIAYDSNPGVNLGTGDFDLAEITLFTGGAPAGGIGFVKLDGVLTSFTSSTAGCPCEIRLYISQDPGGISPIYYTNLYNASGGVDGNVTGAVTWAVSVPTGSIQIFRLQAAFTDSAGPIPANQTRGALTAIYAPFGAIGGSVLNAASASPDDIPQGPQPDAKPDTER